MVGMDVEFYMIEDGEMVKRQGFCVGIKRGISEDNMDYILRIDGGKIIHVGREDIVNEKSRSGSRGETTIVLPTPIRKKRRERETL